MAKDPAVLFYTQDFLVGSSFLTPLQKGHYITLLCYQQQSETGSLTEEKVKSLMGKDFAKNWPVIKQKFKQDEQGFFNERMRKEIDRRKQNSERQRKKVEQRWLSRGNTVVDTAVIPKSGNTIYETEIETENKGGVGETKWEAEKNMFLQGGDWIFNFCRSKKLTVNQFDSIAKEFLNDLELKEDYKVVKEIRSHFTNWFNKKKESIKPDKSGPSNAPPLQRL